MKKDLSSTIEEALGKQLGSQGYDVVDLVPIPARGDKMVRIRTLEDALEDFDNLSGGETVSYLVQVRAKKPPQISVKGDLVDPATELYEFDPEPVLDLGAAPLDTIAIHAPPKPVLDGIYLPDGKLNLAYLAQNAELLYQSGEYVLSRNIYKTILQSGERSGNSHYWIGRCLEAEGKLDEARGSYQESVTFHPSLEGYQRLAAILIREKKDHEAAETMERALGLKVVPESTRFEIHKACGNCWMRAGKHDQAEKNYRLALELNSAADEIQANLGALYLTAGKIAEARRCFQDAVSSNAKNDRALAGLGSCSFAQNEKRMAHDYYTQALEIELNNPTAIFYLVKCAYEIKSYAVAARIVANFIEIAPANTNLMYSLAGLQFHLGRLDDARATAKKILGLQPEHAGASELLKMTDRYAGT